MTRRDQRARRGDHMSPFRPEVQGGHKEEDLPPSGLNTDRPRAVGIGPGLDLRGGSDCGSWTRIPNVCYPSLPQVSPSAFSSSTQLVLSSGPVLSFASTTSRPFTLYATAPGCYMVTYGVAGKRPDLLSVDVSHTDLSNGNLLRLPWSLNRGIPRVPGQQILQLHLGSLRPECRLRAGHPRALFRLLL